MFLSFRGFRFRDVARGSEPMIRLLTMVKALTSLIVGMYDSFGTHSCG